MAVLILPAFSVFQGNCCYRGKIQGYRDSWANVCVCSGLRYEERLDEAKLCGRTEGSPLSRFLSLLRFSVGKNVADCLFSFRPASGLLVVSSDRSYSLESRSEEDQGTRAYRLESVRQETGKCVLVSLSRGQFHPRPQPERSWLQRVRFEHLGQSSLFCCLF